MGRPDTSFGGLDPVDEFLAHYGVKGMKWGVRKDRGHEGQRAKTKKIEKLDKKYDRLANHYTTTIDIHNRAARLTNKNDVERINNKPQYKDMDFSKPSPLRDKYYKEHSDAFIKNLEKAASEMGTNASGTKQYSIVVAPDNDSWMVYLKDVKHADEDAPEMVVKIKRDAKGHILSIEMPEDLEHADLDEFLAHYGVKGMKWGVRKKSSSPSSPGSDDHQNARRIQAKDVKDMSNQELKALTARLNLEKQYKDLTSGQKSEGRKMAEEVLKNTGKNLANEYAKKAAVKGIELAVKAAMSR
jgi:hypothetical protein